MIRPTSSPAGPGQTRPTQTGPATYEIRVAGHLDDHWAATLADLTLIRLDDGTTSLTGPILDQTQLHGVLARIRDLGVSLLTLCILDHPGPAAVPAPETQPGSGAPDACDQHGPRTPDPPARGYGGGRRHAAVPATSPLR